MVCNKTYDPKTMSFKFTGPPHCNKPITKASVKKARVNNKRLEAAARSRPGQSGGGGENGPTKPLCPANPSIPPKKTTLVSKGSSYSGMVQNGATMALKADQMKNAANAGNRACSQRGGGKKKTKRRHRSNRKSRNNRKRNRKSRKTRK